MYLHRISLIILTHIWHYIKIFKWIPEQNRDDPFLVCYHRLDIKPIIRFIANICFIREVVLSPFYRQGSWVSMDWAEELVPFYSKAEVFSVMCTELWENVLRNSLRMFISCIWLQCKNWQKRIAFEVDINMENSFCYYFLI